MSSEAATSLKDQGNAKFKAGKYKEAVQLYSQAIDLEPSNAALFRQVVQQADGAASHAQDPR